MTQNALSDIFWPRAIENNQMKGPILKYPKCLAEIFSDIYPVINKIISEKCVLVK